MTARVDAQAAIRRANERLDAAHECALGPDNGPCGECVQTLAIACDVLALAARLEAAETALREILTDATDANTPYERLAVASIARAALAAGRGEHG